MQNNVTINDRQKPDTLPHLKKSLFTSVFDSINRLAVCRSAKQQYFFIHLCTFTFMHLADAFMQSNLQSIQAINFFYQYVCSLGFEPTTICAANAMLYH